MTYKPHIPRRTCMPTTDLLLLRPPSAQTYSLSLHDALPIWHLTVSCQRVGQPGDAQHLAVRGLDQDHRSGGTDGVAEGRSEEHTSELQSHHDLVCRLLLEKKKKLEGVMADENDYMGEL